MDAPIEATSNYLTKPPLDVLRRQTHDDSSANHIPVKKMGDLGFGNVKKPTEIIPEKNIAQVAPAELKTAETKQVNIFVPPSELVRYLKELMVRDGKRLYLLFFDIQYSSSIEEIIGYIQNKDLGLTEEERVKALGLIGYSEMKAPATVSEVPEEKTEEKQEENTEGNTEEKPKEEIEKKEESVSTYHAAITLEDARKNFATESAAYLSKVKFEKENFAKMMESLGGSKEMPRKDEPEELSEAKKDYFDLRKKSLDLSSDKDLFLMDELLLLQEEMIKQEPEKFQKIASKGFKKWNTLISDSNANAVSLLLGSFDAQAIPEGEVSIQQGNKVVEVKNEEVVLKAEETPKVEPEIRPKLEAAPTAKSFNTEFNGNKIVILYSTSNEGGQVTVFYGGQEIGSGVVSGGKPKLKVEDKYKTSFFLEDSEEEKALKVATNFIKKLKLN
jgi:hypothetical protein